MSLPTVAATSGSREAPICVDLDGTLILTDTLFECALSAIRARPWLALAIPFWMLHGRASLKARLAACAPAPENLPYHAEFLAFLRKEALAGRRLVLATAADRSVAVSIAQHLGLFDSVIASDGKRNAKGIEKLRAIEAEFGDQPFVYAGNSSADLPIWEKASECLVVNATPGLARRIERSRPAVHIREFPSRRASLRTILRQMRVHQWAKNVLVFVPALLGHRLSDVSVLIQAALGMLAFSLTASTIYLMNDLLDLESDRAHPTKRRRPLASGELGIPGGIALLSALLVGAIATISFLPLGGVLLLGGYVVANFAYSTWLKRMLMVDVVTLAAFYSIRVLLGGVATGIPVSAWTLVFSTFLFFSLALAKRLGDLKYLDLTGHSGRGYLDMDRNMVASLASASSLTAVLVLALYIKSPEVGLLYTRPDLLLLICPALAYWLGRMLILTHRGFISDDPVVFALKDKGSYAVGLIIAAVIWIAT